MRLSVVLLTWNEEDNIADSLAALARQSVSDFEVIVVDAASRDATAAMVRTMQADFPVPLRLEVAERRLPFGEARNLGARLGAAPNVAYLSADAEAAPDWVERALTGLEGADMVFGRQVHAPRHWTGAAAVRGLRYRFPAGNVDDPLPYASNVAAAFRKDVLLRFPFHDDAHAAEDLLLAKRADRAGLRAVYDPLLLVRHHDVETLPEEWRKNVREGRAWGRHADELGGLPSLLAWGVALTGSLMLRRRRPILGTAVLTTVLWAPALRRALRHRHDMPPPQIAQGTALSPVFDLAFYLQYLRGLSEQDPSPPLEVTQ